MLQDTDFFKRFEQLSTLGDVHAEVKWEESPSPDERYAVEVQWRFRGKRVGEARIIIEPVVGTDEYRFFWVWFGWVEDWQGKGMLAELIKAYRPEFPRYGVMTFTGAPQDKAAETAFTTQGFKWVDHEFVLDLRAT